MKLAIAAVIALTATALVAPPAAAAETCLADQYIVVPLGVGYLDIREIIGVYTPTGDSIFSIWLYAEAGGVSGNLERGDDLDVTQTPSDAGGCGTGLLPPAVDDLLF